MDKAGEKMGRGDNLMKGARALWISRKEDLICSHEDLDPRTHIKSRVRLRVSITPARGNEDR